MANGIAAGYEKRARPLRRAAWSRSRADIHQRFTVARDTFKTAVPYLSLQFGGAQPGRVRVRAINAEGTGPWSDYTVFTFAR